MEKCIIFFCEFFLHFFQMKASLSCVLLENIIWTESCLRAEENKLKTGIDEDSRECVSWAKSYKNVEIIQRWKLFTSQFWQQQMILMTAVSIMTF